MTAEHPDHLPGKTVWSLSERTIRMMLKRAHCGESPDLLYAELYANSKEPEQGPLDL